MILKFWPRRPRKWPLNLSSLGGCPVDFIKNYIFEISGFHWSKWAIACLIRKTFIFQIFIIQPPRLLRNLKNESFLNKTIFKLWRFKIRQKFQYCQLNNKLNTVFNQVFLFNVKNWGSVLSKNLIGHWFSDLVDRIYWRKKCFFDKEPPLYTKLCWKNKTKQALLQFTNQRHNLNWISESLNLSIMR